MAGIVQVAFSPTLNLTVAVGTVNGIVFYTNIVAVNHNICFHFENPNFLYNSVHFVALCTLWISNLLL